VNLGVSAQQKVKGAAMLPLQSLGERIMVMGPSNAGKSTLALALSDKLNLPTVHLDQLQHLPNTNWQARPEPEFKALHDEAIAADKWIIDGNYSRLIPKRFERATGAILITSNHWLRLARYLKRTMVNPSERVGSLGSAHEYVKWEMIDWILFKTPNNSIKYSNMLKKVSFPTIECRTASELNALYETWNLPSPVQ
jgi:adenylate kinase family enzyme